MASDYKSQFMRLCYYYNEFSSEDFKQQMIIWLECHSFGGKGFMTYPLSEYGIKIEQTNSSNPNFRNYIFDFSHLELMNSETLFVFSLLWLSAQYFCLISFNKDAIISAEKFEEIKNVLIENNFIQEGKFEKFTHRRTYALSPSTL